MLRDISMIWRLLAIDYLERVMKTPIVSALAALLVSLSVSTVSALPPDFSLDGRTVLRGGAPEGVSVANSAEYGTTLRASLTAEKAGQAFALRINDARPEQAYQIRINGSPLEIAPLFAPDGHWYSIPEGAFSAGENVVQITDADGNIVPADRIFAFYIDFGEEEHLNRLVNAGIASPPPIDANQRLYDVQHIDLAITLNPASATIPAAVATLTAKSLTNGLTQCVLDFNDSNGGMTISAVDAGDDLSPLTYSWNTLTDKLTINLASPVAQGEEFTVRVTYSGTPSTGRGLRRSTHSGVPVLYTYGQPYDARYWFPCKDLPEDKFTLEMHATVPAVSYNGHPFSVVSNGKLVSVVEEGGNRTYHWKEDYPLVTQYVSLAASNYQVSEGVYTALDGVTTMPVAHHVYPESYAAEAPEITRTIEVMEWMADKFGEYPFLAEKYVTATWAHSSGLEHQTCTSMPNNNLNTPYHRRNIHELAHMWFGVCVGNETYDHVWLSEGWASYVEALWLEHKNGPAAAETRMNTYRSSSHDNYPIVSSSGDLFEVGAVYYKAAWVLHMLRHVVGDTVFFQSARNFLADPALRYGTAVSADFQNHVEAVYGQDLDWFFDQWLLRASRPSYLWSWAARQEGGDWYVDLGIYQTQADTHYVMPIDFRVTFADSSTTVVTVFNTQRSQSFSVNVGSKQPVGMTFDPDKWLLYGTASNLSNFKPDAPVLQSVIGNGATGTATITWTASAGPVQGYRVYESLDGKTGWTRILDETTLDAGATSAVVMGIAPGESRYYYVTALGVQESGPSDVYGTRLGTSGATVLVVDGYDRALGGGATFHDYAAMHGRAIAAHSNAFDTCANEQVGASIQLGDYRVVVWMCGEESTVDETFSVAEQNLVKAYLEAGGNLFVSGNEIGWDLGRGVGATPAADMDFYNHYLKASFVTDDSNDYNISGSGLCFNGHSFSFGSGDGAYQPGYPDVIAPVNGSSSALVYNTQGGTAAVEYKGTFGSGTTPGALVYMGFAFETVSSEAMREQLMADVLNYFGIPVPVTLSEFMIDRFDNSGRSSFSSGSADDPHAPFR